MRVTSECASWLARGTRRGGRGARGTKIPEGSNPCNGLYGGGGGGRPERGPFFTLQVNEKVGISLVEVYKRVAKSVISV